MAGMCGHKECRFGETCLITYVPHIPTELGQWTGSRAGSTIPEAKAPGKNALQEASDLIHGPRADEYGHPKQNFLRIAKLWNAYFNLDLVGPKDVAILLALLKIARMSTGKTKRDSIVDAAGYLGTLEMLEE